MQPYLNCNKLFNYVNVSPKESLWTPKLHLIKPLSFLNLWKLPPSLCSDAFTRLSTFRSCSLSLFNAFIIPVVRREEEEASATSVRGACRSRCYAKRDARARVIGDLALSLLSSPSLSSLPRGENRHPKLYVLAASAKRK